MNEELTVSANRLPFCFFILHSYFFICFWSPPCRPDAPSGSRQSATEKISRLLIIRVGAIIEKHE
jgi:hypothetical protein